MGPRWLNKMVTCYLGHTIVSGLCADSEALSPVFLLHSVEDGNTIHGAGQYDVEGREDLNSLNKTGPTGLRRDN